MEALTLKCNNPIEGYCREELRLEAFVTSCSHVFCRKCVEKYNFHDPAGGQRACLACKTVLPTEDDVRQANFRPNEAWKATILAGQQPSVVNEVMGKTSTFWDYQLNAQLAWERHLSNQWSKKYSGLHKHAAKVIDEANTEISDLQDQIAALKKSQQESQRQMHDLVSMYNEKKQAFENVDKLYRTLKTKVQQGEAQEAAKMSMQHRSFEDVSRPSRVTIPHRPEPRLNVPDLPLLNKTPHLGKFETGNDHIERLHTYQRSGSIRHTSSDLAARAMPPPVHVANGRMHTARTPAHRPSYPVSHSNHTYPMSAVRPVNHHDYTCHHSADGYRPSLYSSRPVNRDPNTYARRPVDGGIK